jgi:hypothetical protein
VKCVQEFFGDFYAIDPHCFTFNLPRSLDLTVRDVLSSSLELDSSFDRSVKGIVAAFLALKLQPVIR